MKNKVAVISDSIIDEKALSRETYDTFYQVQNVCMTLEELGFKPVKIKFDFNIENVAENIAKLDPVFIFNLVEAEDKIVMAPLIFENAGIPFTGAGSFTLASTNNKISMKHIIFNSKYTNIKTPDYFYENGSQNGNIADKYIIKAVGFHASVNIDDSFVVEPSSYDDLNKILLDFRMKYGIEHFAEQYIDGREFNVAALDKKILPLQEIVFDYPEGKNKILCFKSKWEEDSFEYKKTNRSFAQSAEDAGIIDKMIISGSECVELFKLNSYARIDYRVNEQGDCFIIDINANPCISPDAGFTAACAQAGISYKEMIKRIIAAMQ